LRDTWLKKKWVSVSIVKGSKVRVRRDYRKLQRKNKMLEWLMGFFIPESMFIGAVVGGTVAYYLKKRKEQTSEKPQ
jgi:quinol-cytochrome oxidoreductase complex cytochrome b subunit